ncbi:hypothetical protein Trco_003444 [Trichoderma cornu-damae]|uniref:Zn(2)-C6 fungal-type domain-containing protein n=1 Tax=Trichoderma cornu-damae TaxID=654480 RepID=A0A9P8TT97_9HYPO|nr:hypothetical protein Trco_003444 [Trichoderma cornu-damae]
MASATVPMESWASKACKHCRLHKRRCDKRLPRCSRCASKFLRCEYDDETPLESEPDTKPRWSEPLAIRRGSCGLELSSAGEKQLLWAACRGQEPQPDQADGKALMSLVKDVFSYGDTSVEQVSHRYFATFQSWLPIIDEPRTKFDLRIMQQQVAEALYDSMALLLLCMHLLSQRPCHHPNHTSNSVLYRTTRRLFLLLETPSRVPSLTRLQAGLLLTAYECGHGLAKEASSTLGTCFGLVRQLDMSALLIRAEDSHRPEDDLISTRRCIVLSCVDGTARLLIPTREILPLDAVPYLRTDNSLALMDSVYKFRVKAFSALGIGEATRAVHGDPESSDCVEAERLLHDLIRQHSATPQGGSYPMCEGVSMALSAVVSAYKKRVKRLGSAADAKLNLDIKFAYNIVFEICRAEGSIMWMKEKTLDRMYFASLSCLYRAAVDLDELYPKGASPEDAKQLRENLEWFSRHWEVADGLLQRLNRNAELRSKQVHHGFR